MVAGLRRSGGGQLLADDGVAVVGTVRGRGGCGGGGTAMVQRGRKGGKVQREEKRRSDLWGRERQTWLNFLGNFKT